jgi:hypothetical protein
MNFAITWLFDKLGYMPKIDMEIGKVKIDTQSPEFKMWPFPVVKEDKDFFGLDRPVKKPVAKKATKVAAKKTKAKK